MLLQVLRVDLQPPLGTVRARHPGGRPRVASPGPSSGGAGARLLARTATTVAIAGSTGRRVIVERRGPVRTWSYALDSGVVFGEKRTGPGASRCSPSPRSGPRLRARRTSGRGRAATGAPRRGPCSRRRREARGHVRSVRSGRRGGQRSGARPLRGGGRPKANQGFLRPAQNCAPSPPASPECCRPGRTRWCRGANPGPKR